jgi:hypothetical protein
MIKGYASCQPYLFAFSLQLTRRRGREKRDGGLCETRIHAWCFTHKLI